MPHTDPTAIFASPGGGRCSSDLLILLPPPRSQQNVPSGFCWRSFERGCTTSRTLTTGGSWFAKSLSRTCTGGGGVRCPCATDLSRNTDLKKIRRLFLSSSMEYLVTISNGLRYLIQTVHLVYLNLQILKFFISQKIKVFPHTGSFRA